VDLATALARGMGQVKDMEQVVLMEEAMEAVVAVEVAVVKVAALAMDLDPALVMEVATATGTSRLFLRARYKVYCYKYVTKHESVLLLEAVFIVCNTTRLV